MVVPPRCLPATTEEARVASRARPVGRCQLDPRGSACAFSEAPKASAPKPPLGRTPAFWLTEVKYSFPFS